MDVDNQINEVIETRQLRSGTPLGRNRVDTPTRRRSMRARNQASSEKAEKSTTVSRVTETITSEVNYVKGSKSQNDREASIDISDSEKKRESSSRSSYRRTVLNGASVEEDTDVIVLDDNEPQTVTTTKTSVVESGYSSDESSKTRLRAYDIYKSAGEYWDVYPKTDYTYSRSSTDRKEISPGVINPPNMSRRSLHPRTIPSISDIRKQSPTTLLVTKRDVKSEVTSRYFSDRKSDGYVSEKLRRWAAVDSDVDEVDEKISTEKAFKAAASKASVKSVVITRVVTVWTYLTSFVSLVAQRVRRIFQRENYLEEVHFSSVELESEREATSWQKFRGSMLYWATCFQTWVVAWVLYWLHGGHGHVSAEDRRRRKYLQLLLLGLLPLLLLLGLYVAQDSSFIYQDIKESVLQFIYEIPVAISHIPSALSGLLSYVGKIPQFFYQLWLSILDLTYQLPNPFYVISDILYKIYGMLVSIPDIILKVPGLIASIPEKVISLKESVFSFF